MTVIQQEAHTGNQFNAHPLYIAMQGVWDLSRDCFAGEATIKLKASEYLPPTSGMVADGYGTASKSVGQAAYDAYLKRAYFPTIVEDAIESAIGIMHRKPANITLSPKLQSLFEVATDDGEDIQLLLRRINAQQLKTGRVPLLGTVREVGGKVIPLLIAHEERSVFNWDDTTNEDSSQNLRLLQIDESNYELTDSFAWEWVSKVRNLAIVNPETGRIVNFREDGFLGDGVYASALLVEESDRELSTVQFEPLTIQGQEFDRIPFTFINSKDLSSKPDKPPLLSLCSLALAIYRGEADYRQNLFMQGQDTLVRIGASPADDEAVRIGTGSTIDVPMGGDAKFVGVSGQGLSEQRQCLENDYARADKKASKLMSNSGAESGEALKIRVAAQTATLPQIAKAGAAGLEKVLRDLAEWLGDNPDDIVVTPNLEFTDATGDAQTLTGIVQAKIAGAPISDESIHAFMVEQGFTHMNYLDELAKIQQEEPRV